MRSTAPQKFLAVLIIVFALLLATPLRDIAAGAAVLLVVGWLLVRFLSAPVAAA